MVEQEIHDLHSRPSQQLSKFKLFISIVTEIFYLDLDFIILFNESNRYSWE